ncbi:MAG TPA: hypothetical protein VJS92_11805 [Candidatus Polarisedimenticolaceae bacterium]|nr:hypothetical protein [Candidatus Polarisedimenticolaceae bacterium]
MCHAAARAFLIDDAYISFRYAANLADGQGLVFNAGERVEGYSNLLWVLLLAAGARLGLEPEWLSQALGLAAGFALVPLAAIAARRLLPADAAALALLPALWIASNRSLAAWSTGGLETRLFTLLLAAGLLLLADELDRGAHAFPRSCLPLGLALLCRADGFVPVAALLGALVWIRRGRVGKHGGLLFALLGAVAGSHVLFRLVYYGALLPNTFHVKVTGVEWAAGLDYLLLAVRDYGLWLMLPLALVPLAPPRSSLARLARATVLVQLAYLLAIGGDHFEFRFLDPLWVPLFVLAAAGLHDLARRVPARATLRAAVAAGLVVTVWNAVPSWRGFESTAATISVEREAALCRSWREVGDWFRQHAAPGEVISVRPAGVIPYRSRLRAFDELGLNDPVVARRPPDPSPVAGHRKQATWEDILVRGHVNYYIHHPDLRPSRPTPVPPRVIAGDGRAFALIPVSVELPSAWLQFEIVSEEAVLPDGVVDLRRVKSGIHLASNAAVLTGP